MEAVIFPTGDYRRCSPSDLSAFRDKRCFPWKRVYLSVFSTRRSDSLSAQSRLPSLKKNQFKVFASLHRETSTVIKARFVLTFFLLELENRSMNEIYDALAERLLPVAAMINEPHHKYIVGLAGPPGAGKTTLAAEVVRRINMIWPHKASTTDSQVEPPDVAIVLPMDGFHLYRSQLDAMEDPKEAYARRGAPWTFDPERLLKCLNTIRNQGSIYAPSFDHGVGDPIEDDIFVSLQHKVVIVEGNYILLEDGVWMEISSIFDEKWFIDLDINTAMQRLQDRHISTGKAPDIAKWRIEYNDRPNAELIMKSRKNADVLIESVDM